MRRKVIPGMIFAAAALALAGMAPTAAMAGPRAAESDTTMNDDSRRLHDLFAADWAWTMAEFPEFATRVGVAGNDHRWTDMSAEALARRDLRPRQSLLELERVQRTSLSPADQLNYDLYRKRLENQIAAQRFPGDLLPLNQMSGVQQDIPQTLDMMPRRSVADYDNILARLAAAPALIDQNLALLSRGVEAGVTPPRITLRDVPQQVENAMAADGPLMVPFARFSADIPGKEQERISARARALVDGEVRPALARLHAYMVKSYLPAARESIGLSKLPDGEAWYAHRVRQSTTTGLTPQEIHDIGLGEVKRIRAAMGEVIEEAGFTGTFAEFLVFLRTDPRFYYDNAKDLLAAYRDIAKRADPELVRLFGHLPRLPYGVLPVPAYAEKSQTTAYYQPGSLAAGRPGVYFANTYALDTRPRWEMEALSLHESVPGHHLQIALTQEMEAVPDFRRFGLTTAFVEGWGLYAESLGKEMGFYTDPYSHFGQLTYEMWRAIRLVVDTGMHALGWSRQQALDFFKENAGKSEHDIIVEVDRYIVWPGQALAYKIGELKMQELRRRAEVRLGAAFDIRAFHDELLGQGALPLDVLEARMDDWLQRQAATGSGAGSGSGS